MTGMTTLKLELNIAAEQLAKQMVLRNEMVEGEVKRGMEMAFEAIAKDDNFAIAIRDQVFEEIKKSIGYSLGRYGLNSKLSDLVHKKISSKLDELAEDISEKVLSGIKL